VNTVGFGVVETAMTETIRREKFRVTYLAQIPLGRYARRLHGWRMAYGSEDWNRVVGRAILAQRSSMLDFVRSAQ
jgi:hypothetical protein